MTRWRLGAAVLLVFFAGVPALLPFYDLLRQRNPFEAWVDAPRLLALAENTALLVGGTAALALPAGIALAVLLFRTDLPFRRGFQFLTALSLFVPLPVMASAWQATLGSGGWLPRALWPDAAGRPWAEGLGPAIWIHALASLPWTIWIVGIGLCWVEPELEEDALLAAGQGRVLCKVTLPRSVAALGAATLFLVLQTAGDITVTDLMQVRTFAEEVYTQLSMGGGDALARSVAISLPAVMFAWLITVAAVVWIERHLPAIQTLLAHPRLFSLGRGRWPCLVLTLIVMFLLAGVPLISLAWKTGLRDWPPAWSADSAWVSLRNALRLHGPMVASSLALAVLAGTLTASAGLRLAWLGTRSASFALAVLSLAAGVWTIPGPVLGIGFKDTIQQLLDWLGSNQTNPDWAAMLLYYGPSPLPVLWVQIVRFLPFAVAMLWPVARLLPAELSDSARLDGATPGQEYRVVVKPLTRRAWRWTALAVAALALGEISASKLVETPGSETFCHLVFDRMHYGVTSDVAALCLVFVGAVLMLGLVGATFSLRTRQRIPGGAGQSVPRFPRCEPPPR
jgi:iron(III) transport system permease protein